MATHSSILAWRIPWTVQSMEWQRIGHNWAAITFKPDPGDTAALIKGVGEDRVVHGTFQKSKILWLLEYKVQQMGNKKRGTINGYCTKLNTRDLSREGNGTPLQYSCLENPIGRGGWWAAVHGVAKNQTRLSDFTFTFHFHALEKKMAAHSVFLPGESQGRGSLVGCHLWGRTDSDTTEAT